MPPHVGGLALRLDDDERLRLLTALLTGHAATISAEVNGVQRRINLPRSTPFEPRTEAEAIAFLDAVRALLLPFLTLRAVTVSDVESYLSGALLDAAARASLVASAEWCSFPLLTAATWAEVRAIAQTVRTRGV